MFTHLDRLAAAHPDGIPSSLINSFIYAGQPQRLIVQPGIWKPKHLSAALSIRTTFARSPADRPYQDEVGADGLMRYKYRGTDPNHADNRALRSALQQGAPLVYFVGVAKSVYQAIYPVFLLTEEAAEHQFVVGIDEQQALLPALRGPEPAAARKYAQRLLKLRLHQPIFRARVLRAYGSSCAMCGLHLPQLVEAAHILSDSHPRGEPVVPNGLALCKIHHAAFDANILGVRPDLIIEVRPDILSQTGGPMFKYGLQETHGTRLQVPHQVSARPDPARLEERYLEFRRQPSVTTAVARWGPAGSR
ncbi:HNH endonuclease [Virgisporangium aurantiacum]|uniref:HNH endonuclease n=2 Tax=Virgisporangium aurantiacum TaxID=175570 RepID=A0A8J3Z0D0_9ACTN|nr:HNH endonuclease [Virgisporangium aurantiacum]